MDKGKGILGAEDKKQEQQTEQQAQQQAG